MATIPIEVIVQDAEAPIVPSEDGTNTNITVPDTGTISNNGDTSSSASSIILPAILLILAIGSIVAILIHKYHKQKNNKTTRKEKLAVATSSTIAILAVTVLIGNLVLPATKAATSDITDGITPAEDKVSIVVTRDGGVAEASIESTATITSTSDFGYKVLLSMAEGVETANLYLDGNEDSEYYIASTESTELADNTWGYAITEDGEYSAVPLVDDAVIVAQGDEVVEDESLSIYYGVKVSSDLPAGVYSGGEVEYTLESVPGFPDTLVYMQDMTPEICAAAPTPGKSVTDPVPTATLEDIRDHNTYTIAKLADGKCWMTQNLDLDLNTEVTLTPANTNIIENWKPANSTISFSGSSIVGWNDNSDSVPYSADSGDVYYYTSGSNENDIRYESLEACVESGHTETDCKHYHVGNYYNWTAAIASNNSSEFTQNYSNATSSICPKGWTLPLGAIAENEFYGSIINMVGEYNGILGDRQSATGGGYYSYMGNGFNMMRAQPLWLVRAGNINHGSNVGAGSSGYFWSSTNRVDYSAYALVIRENSVTPNAWVSKSNGQSIRCVAQ